MVTARETGPPGDGALEIAAGLVECRSREQVLACVTSDASLAALGAAGVAVYVADTEGRALRRVARRGRPTPAEVPVVALDTDDALALAAGDGAVRCEADGRTVVVPLLADGALFGALRLVFAAPVAEATAASARLGALGTVIARALRAADGDASPARTLPDLAALRAANAEIADALAVLPEATLRTAVRSEFRLWPSLLDAPQPPFLIAVLEKILRHAVALTGAEHGALGIGDSPARPFEPWLVFGVTAEQRAMGRPPPRPVGTLGLVALDGEVVRTDDVRTHPAFRGLPPGHPPIGSFLGVPIRYRSANLGNLFLGDKRGASGFTEVDQTLVELMAAQAAIALQHAYFHAVIDVQRAQLQSIFESTPHGLIFVEARSQHLIANARAVALLGRLAPEDGPQQLVGRLLHTDDRPLSLAELPTNLALRGETVMSKELTLRRPGRALPVLLSAAPVRGPDGAILGAIVSFEDVSAVKALERLREEFAAVVAHDLRDPIQSIILNVDVLRRRRAGDEVHAPWTPIERIEQSAHRLGQISHDLLDSVRIELGRLTLERERRDLVAVARALVTRLGDSLGPHAVTVEASEPCVAPVDVVRLEQILTNLLDNAGKFSTDGAPIVLRVARDGRGVALAVEDRGVGLTGDELARLFDRFYQSRRARARKTGLGLGLYITRGLVEAHGGRISVASEPGRGSTFTVWLPADATGPEAALS